MMKAGPRSWQQKIKQHPVVGILVFVGSALGIALIVVIVLGYWLNWDWTGLGTYIPPTKDSNFQRGKTLWDWMQLLIIPIILAIGGFWLNQIQKDREQKATAERAKREKREAEQRAELERKLTRDNQRETALQAYIDKISELLLKEHLGKLPSDDKLKPEYEEVRKIARVRTLTTLKMLNGSRKGALLQFLYEAGLIYHLNSFLASKLNLPNIDGPIIELSKTIYDHTLLAADLQGAVLSGADLGEADLTGINLRGANLPRANLQGAYLSEANLSEANLSEADLSGALQPHLWRETRP